MIIKINGRDEIIAEKLKLSALVESKELSSEKIVIEHNFAIIPKEKWQGITLQVNDQVEIIGFMGGG